MNFLSKSDEIAQLEQGLFSESNLYQYARATLLKKESTFTAALRIAGDQQKALKLQMECAYRGKHEQQFKVALAKAQHELRGGDSEFISRAEMGGLLLEHIKSNGVEPRDLPALIKSYSELAGWEEEKTTSEQPASGPSTINNNTLVLSGDPTEAAKQYADYIKG